MPEATRPAGWYPDPNSDRHWRWWDGASWTSNTAPRWARTAPGDHHRRTAAKHPLPATATLIEEIITRDSTRNY